MKRLYIALVLCLLFISAFSQQKNIIAVGFYNLENYYDTLNDPNTDDDEFTPNGANAYTPAVFEKKVDNLATILSQMATDKTSIGLSMVGVAEIENEWVLKVLCDHPKLKPKNWKVVHFDGPDGRGVDCGLLYNPTLFKVLSAASLTVPIDPGDRPTRDVLYVYGKLDGEPVHVFVNHWPSRRGGEAITREKRKTAAAVSKKIIDSLMNQDPMTKVIVMGDLNDDPINASVTEVLNAKPKIKQVIKGGLFNPWTDFYNKGLGTLAYQDTWGLFDQIIISYGFFGNENKGMRYSGAEVYNKSFMIEKFGQYRGYPKRSYSNGVWNDGYSDHFPTIVYFVK